MTSGTRRGGTSKFSSSEWADSPLFAPQNDTVAYDDANPFGEVNPFIDISPFGHCDPTVPVAPAIQQYYDNSTVGEGGETEPVRNDSRYAGRHAARKRARLVIPVVAAAATLVAGAGAAYALSGGARARTGNLSASMTLHRAVASAPVAGIGNANEGASAPMTIATAKATDAARATAKRAAKAAPSRSASPSTVSPSRTATVAPSAAASRPAAQSRRATPTATREAATPAASSPVTTNAAATIHTTATLSCNLSSGLLPENVSAIVSFLLAHGYSDNAAAGIAGNIYQESKGDPESVGTGGGGLIGWTPLPAGFVTGNVAADLQTQLAQILVYNQGWSQFLPALNSAASPADAASVYVTDFERAGIPAASTREASAQDVASAYGI